MSASKAQQAITARRRVELLKLAAAGKNFQDIADELGYSSRQHASKDLCRVLELAKSEERFEADTYRELEAARLDELQAAMWEQALAGDPRAVDTVLRISDRRSKLLGLDMPVKAEVSGPDGGAIALGPVSLAQLHKLIGTAGDGEDDDHEDEDPGDDGNHTED